MKSGLVAILVALTASAAVAEVMLQYFETEWEEMYRRMPEIAEIGYDYIWVPPPTKGPTGKGTKWSNVGYNLYDRFDIGDIPQRGSLATRYGTRGDLRNMVDKAHQCDVKIIPDIVVNHNGNGPDFREYPGMAPEDFHVQWWPGYYNNLDYRPSPRMSNWDDINNGYGRTMWEALAGLIDIRSEQDFDQWRFTGGNNTPGWNFVDGVWYVRHVGQYDKYPYFPAGYTNESAPEMLNRWIAWLGDAMDYDGLRIDAGKHIPWEFFGRRGWGFLHEAQWNFNQRRGYTDSNDNEADQLFQNYIRRDDALLFAEILSGPEVLSYWFGGDLDSVANNHNNPMRFLDYPIHERLRGAVNGGDLNDLHLGGGGLNPDVGIMYIWGHDDDADWKRPYKAVLAYAYLLTHVGLPMVYTTGNNLQWSDSGRKPYPESRTWMVPGFDSHALGDQSGDLVNLVWIHQNFARGREWERWSESDFYAFERYDDKNFNASPDENEGLLLVALNDSGTDQTRNNVTVSFEPDTVLHDYTGNNPTDITVYDNGGTNQVNVTVPANGGQGYVCYAPKVADPVTLAFLQGGSPAPTMTWIVPGGEYASDKTNQIPRLTAQNIRADVTFDPKGGSVDSVMLKWGQGNRKLTASNYWETNSISLVAARFEKCNHTDATNWFMDIDVDAADLPEGLNVVKARVFNELPETFPARFNTATKVVYVDRHGPELDIEYPAEGQTVTGDAVMIIRNPDFTAYGVTVGIGGVTNTAHEIMKGLWKYSLTGLSAGPQTITVTATEADWGSPRAVINTGVATRNITVADNPHTISLTHADGAVLEVPFFATGVNAPGASDVTLYWDGYELPFNAGTYTNVFNGEVVFRDDFGRVVDERLWGCFVNGQHFFEAIRVDGGVTSRAVSRVTFNLYGVNAIDTDGDGLPDNVEMPFFDDGAPGGDQPLPGDNPGDPDFIPKDESWTRLNPYNHSTYYIADWDDSLDSDSDGYPNKTEVLAGYAEGNIYAYNIFDGGSYPSGTPIIPAEVTWTPSPAEREQVLTIRYTPNDGPLSNASQVVLHIGHSDKTQPAWQDTFDTNMTFTGSLWEATYLVPESATSVDFVFHDGASNWDNNGGDDWRAEVNYSSSFYFTMDGNFDSDDYTVFPDGMRILAAVKENNLYVATWGTPGGGNDHFLYVTDEFGDSANIAPGWNKSAGIYMDTSTKPWIAAEGDNGYKTWNNAPTGGIANGAEALEGEINLVDVFGHVPEAVYVAAVAFQTWNDGNLVSQGPYVWDGGNNIEITEFLRVPIASVRDEDLDGYFDMGKPEMWTVVNGNTNDANYGLRRVFLDELAGDYQDLTVILEPNVAPGDTVSDVELFSNINRRDYAVATPETQTVTTNSVATYYRAYPMAATGGGRYEATIRVAKCGAYRVNARYRVNGGDYVYYTDHGLRRDCAVVVSPKKTLDLVMYELNPMFAEATSDQKAGRSTFRDMAIVNTNKPDRISTNHFTSLGVNMIWLQPIHPIGTVNREEDPDTGQPYEPGSPYAVKDYWKVNPVLGAEDTDQSAMQEFQEFVSAMDDVGVGVMLDGTFNHSAWDCEIGAMGVDMGISPDPAQPIRTVRSRWYSKEDNYDEQAEAEWEIAPAPDRFDFGKWGDAADFHFGNYDALVGKGPSDTNNWGASKWKDRFLLEEDRLAGLDEYSLELWEYFAAYALYWLEKTGVTESTPKSESFRGIDGLRCDFAQGLPSQFWEYCINRTRSVKWDFIFMAESLDGYREVAGSKRHGVGYRSARHFDILNENIVFYWRNDFFAYPYQGVGGANWGKTPVPETYPTQQAFDDRRNAFDACPLLLNLTSHDEVYPSNDPWKILYAYAQVGVIDGVPMLLYGQEAGAKNDADTYDFLGYGTLPTEANNFSRYETNFGKSIANFKRFNCMTNIWNNRDWELQFAYGRISSARLTSPALKGQGVYFLSREDTDQYDPDIFAVAKFEEPGVSAATQEVVFAFVNNNYWDSQSRWATFKLDADYQGKNWFGIEPGHRYNIVDLISTNSSYIWPSPTNGTDLISQGILVGLTGDAVKGEQAQYLRLVDVDADYDDGDLDGLKDFSDPDDDNDGIPDWFESMYGLNPNDPDGVNGASGDKDGDGVSNYNEWLARTNPNDKGDVLRIDVFVISNGNARAEWPAKIDRDYRLEATDDLGEEPVLWWPVTGYRTALSERQAHVETITPDASNQVQRVVTKP